MRKVIGVVPLFLLIRLCYLVIFFQVWKFPALNGRKWWYFLISRKWFRIDEWLVSRHQLSDSGWKYRIGEWPALDGLPPEYKSEELSLHQFARFAVVLVATYTSPGPWPFQRLVHAKTLHANFEVHLLDPLHWWCLVCR